MARRSLQDLNLIDNFLFFSLIDHERYGPIAARTILETILQRKVRIGKITSEKVLMPQIPGRHGIRMDAFIQEKSTDISGGDVFDLEPENKTGEKEFLPKRARYYHAKIDNKTLESGKRYRELRPAWVIFITSYDPFGEGQMVYTVKSRCVEVPDLEYEDGAVTLFLYVNGARGNAPKELEELLRYMGNTVCGNACNERLREIQGFVDDLKQDPEVKEEFMSFEDFLMAERREAVQQAEAERDQFKAERDQFKTERDAQAKRAEIAETKLDAYSAEIEKLRTQVADLQNHWHS